MKKSLLAIALMAVVSMTASAVSIAWESSALSFGGTVLKSNKNVTGYLIALSDGTLPSFTVDDLFNAESVGGIAASDIDGTSKKGGLAGTLQFVYPAYENGQSFALLVSYTDAVSNKTYWNLSNDIRTLSGLVDDITPVPDFTEFTLSDTVNATNTLTAGGGWAPAAVPEPATGVLALAGVALLFRRKRA